MGAKRWLAIAMALGLWVAALSGLAEMPAAELLPEQVIAAPVEVAPVELEAELPDPEAGIGAGLVLAAEDTGAAGLEAIVAPAATAAPEAIVAPEASATPEATQAPAQELTLNARALALGVKETFTLKAVAGAEGAKLTFRSSDAKVAKVSSTGRITARKRGSAVVNVTLPDGRSAACRVTVKAAPKSVSLNAERVKLGYDKKRKVGSSFALKATLPANTASQIRYGGYDPAVATVSEDGVIRAVGRGRTTVTVSTFNGKTASVKVTVLNAPKKLALDRTALSMFPGDTCLLTPILPKNTAGSVAFESSDPAVAAVDAETGEVRGVALGSAVITATAFNGRKASCAVEVGYTPKKLSISRKKATLGVGEGFALTARPLRKNGKAAGGTVYFTSGNSDVAAVDADGVVTGVGPGTATVAARLSNGVRASCRVTVKAAPTSVKLVAASPKLTVGGRTKLKVTLSRDSASALTWSSEDVGVASVSAKGEVMAIRPGETRVSVTTFNGLSASCALRVFEAGRRQTTIIAHRGGAGDWPENSLEAFRHAAATGADDVELDVRTAKDGAQVIHHDATFSARGRKYTIEELTLEQIQALDGDICSLDEALQVISAAGLGLQLEMKDSADPEACVNAVARYGMEKRVCYIAFDPVKLMRVRALRPGARVGLLFTSTPSNLEQTLAALKPDALCQKARYLTQDNLIAWQSRGYLVGAWTLNEIDLIREQLEMGVDYLTSDDPRLAAEMADR